MLLWTCSIDPYFTRLSFFFIPSDLRKQKYFNCYANFRHYAHNLLEECANFLNLRGWTPSNRHSRVMQKRFFFYYFWTAWTAMQKRTTWVAFWNRTLFLNFLPFFCYIPMMYVAVWENSSSQFSKCWAM